jgi:hypothetical protein
MKPTNTLLYIILLIIMPLTMHGQLLNKLKRAAQDGVEKAVERRVSQEIENAAARQTNRYMDQVFGPPSEYEGTDYDYGKMLGNMNVETEDSYSFTGYTDMELTGTDEKGKAIDPMQLRSFLSQEGEYWAMQMENNEKDLENAIMIFDQPNEATIMLMEDKKGEKSMIAYGLDWSKMMEAGAEEGLENTTDSLFSLTKTGNSKTILGYACDEYMTDHPDYSATYWVSAEHIDGYTSYWSKNNFLFSQQMKKKYQAYFDKLPDGDVLEMNYVSKKDKGTTRLVVTDIDTNTAFNFVMADYLNIMEEKK